MVRGVEFAQPTTVALVGNGLRADLMAQLLEGAGCRVDRVAEHDPTPASTAVSVLMAHGKAEVATVLAVLAQHGAPVLVVTDGRGPAAAAALVHAGAASVMTEAAGAQELAAAVRLTSRGHSVVEPALALVAVRSFRADQARDGTVTGGVDALTDREREVLTALSEGLTGKAVGRALGISLKTVEAHKASIFSRLGVRTQSQAVAVAVRAGLVPPATNGTTG